MSQQHYPISKDVSRIQDVNFVSPNMSQQHYPISIETFRVIQEVAISGNRKWQKSQLFSRAGAPDVDTADATSRLTTATPGWEKTARRRVESGEGEESATAS